MKRVLFLLGLGLLLIAAVTSTRLTPAKVATNHPGTVVLELFTSQGCSSCPPADRLLSTLGREDFAGRTVIPLAYHVDYWNYLGWRDPFSSARWSDRQRRYAQKIQASQVYTPQLVVNGTEQMVGNAEHPVRAEIGRQLQGGDRGIVTIDDVARHGNELAVKLHARVDKDVPQADLVVALFESGITTAVRSGENADRSLTNDFIVRWEDRATAVHANADATATVTIPIAKDWNANHLGVAAFLQDPTTLAIYGSAVR